MYVKFLKVLFIKKDIGDRRCVYYNYEEWFNESYGIYYICVFVIIEYICKIYKCGVFENEVKVLKKKIKDVFIFYNFLKE